MVRPVDLASHVSLKIERPLHLRYDPRLFVTVTVSASEFNVAPYVAPAL